MPFYFRKGRRGLFKHIAHGLIPAATIAPKPAVPRTPPPRSPNPSPERPRSALAAAILVTTLTGRTVAIPQPRQRSFSESDASYLQDQEECIEPYATVTELRMGPNWQSDGDERKAVQTLEASGSCEDDDMDTFTSDTERESDPDRQIIDKKESMSHEMMYAMPHRIKQENLPVSSSANGEDSSVCEPSCLIQPNVQVEEIEYPGVRFKGDNSGENPLNEKPPSSSDAVLHRKQEQMVLPREKFQKLKEQHWHLNNANQTLFSELEQSKQLMKELQLKIKTLEKENRQFKEKQNSHSEEEGAELVLLRQQAQELVDENDSLKMTVHRLNAELSRYQTKYRPISPSESVKIGSLPMKKPIPPWLLDMKYLSPLLLAYEDRMKEKEELILEHEESMKMFKAQVEEVVKENEQLHHKLSKNTGTFISTKEWQHLQSQAKLVLEENRVLMEQLKIQETKINDTINQHVTEVSKLTKQLILLETEKQNQEVEMKDCQKKLRELRSAYKELKANVSDYITAEEHIALENKFKNQLQMEQEKREMEIQELMKKLASVQAETKSLLLEKNDLLAENKTLEAELEMARKTKRRSQKKVDLLKQHLEETMEKEMAAHQYLVNMISLAENVTQERDQLLNLASCLEKEKHSVLNKIIEGNVRLGKLEEKVKVYKKTAAGKLGDISLKATEREKEFAGKTAQYQREMKHLQRLLQEKQESLDEALQQKREMENELEIIWESTAKENRRMKEFLHKSLEKNAQNSVNAAHESQLTDISQKVLLGKYGFSYCDVEVSSPPRAPNEEEP
ncbi:centrosomal protein of 89 kDa isoform X1 [Crotalus tigris]|uniref:centrosomal protein of 89 kDa isoform X1 n=2 Tax=Crotalus tigris TaxID=88082 RepID=UPI00192F51DF|nr:centrosomal protein of 89 kDa isoform X1 [Crotalus tigris]